MQNRRSRVDAGSRGLAAGLPASQGGQRRARGPLWYGLLARGDLL